MPTNTKSLNCTRCDGPVHNVGRDAVQVLCWKCTLKLINRNIDETIDRNANTGKLSEDTDFNREGD